LSEVFATDFYEIIPALSKNSELKGKVLSLIESRPVMGKAIEEENRKIKFREILKKLVEGEITDLKSAEAQVQVKISRNTSKYSSNNKIFSQDWAERLVRTQLSIFYNQAVMEIIINSGKEECFIPHSAYEDYNSFCTTKMAGKKHKVKELYNKLIDVYENENYDRRAITIPQHPNCTHVIRPID